MALAIQGELQRSEHVAHQTNVNQVKANIPSSTSSMDERVKDPMCGMTLSKRESRHMVFRESGTYYFCSKTCQQNFMRPSSRAKVA